MTAPQIEHTFEPFADTVEYRSVNNTIVHDWIETMIQRGSKEINRLLDIATGVGTMVHLFLENLPKHWQQPTIVCLDRSAEALEQAKASLESEATKLELIHSSAENLDLPEQSVDVVVWGNGIHYLDIEGQEKVLRAVRKTLKLGGWFFFNSAFYAEARPPDTIPFYRAHIRRAVEYLRAQGIGRDRKEARPEASNFLPKAHYENLPSKVGFVIEEVKEVAARVRVVAWEHISAFREYAAGALHGYQPDAAAEAMRKTVPLALEEHGQRDEHGDLFIVRNWLAVSARAV